MRAALLYATAATFAASSFAREPVHVEFLCMTTFDDKPIRLEWRTFFEPESKSQSAYVKYKGAKQVIPLVFRSSKAGREAPTGSTEFTQTWLEVVDGRISGEYEIFSQGAMVYSFVYRILRTKKETAFGLANDPVDGSECKWS